MDDGYEMPRRYDEVQGGTFALWHFAGGVRTLIGQLLERDVPGGTVAVALAPGITVNNH